MNIDHHYSHIGTSNITDHSDHILKYAVEVNNLYRNYGKNKILKGLNMYVPVGSIYGLLGPSGCGKTTYLKILLGRLSSNGGNVYVFNKPPGTYNHPIPGIAIGYMPQESALYPEFTIEETLEFYSRLYGMSAEHFMSRKRFLLDFLSLPTEDRLIRNLSGGQQRRVSLCVALLHNPPLLILDEPTVGVDPMLRSKIWSYLVELSQTGVSIIITTHYIEEARMANCVGLMRDGKMLAEGSPLQLMQQNKEESLEAVFLKLCSLLPDIDIEDDVGGNSSSSINSTDFESLKVEDSKIPLLDVESEPVVQIVHGEADKCCGGFPTSKNLFALIWRNFKRLSRNYGFLLFQFLLPAVQVILFCVAIGRDPENLHLSVINQDLGLSKINNSTLNPTMYSSKLYLAQLGIDPTYIVLDYYNTTEDALNTVKSGASYGVVSFGPTFSQDLYTRMSGIDVTSSVIKSSTVYLDLDMTDQQISLMIQSKASTAFDAFVYAALSDLHSYNPNINPDIAQLPITIEPPIYGEINPKFTDFIAPGMIINIAFAQSIGLTALAFVIEKREGTMDRTWCAGVRPSEVLLGHVITQFFVLLVQVGLLLFFALYVFALPMLGSLFLVFLLTMMLGMSGMLYGLYISSVCDKEQEAIQMSLGSFFPILLLSGVIWPVEAIPIGLKYFSLALPTTWAATAMRCILDRGWGLEKQEVWTGFLVVLAWGLLFLFAASRGLKSRD